MNHEIFLAYRDTKICGYVVLRKCRPPEKNHGVIVELGALPNDAEAIRALLGFGIAHLHGAAVTHIIAATSVPEYATAYKKFGFTETTPLRPMAVCHDPVLGKQLAEPRLKWFLGRGDHDLDRFPLV